MTMKKICDWCGDEIKPKGAVYDNATLNVDKQTKFDMCDKCKNAILKVRGTMAMKTLRQKIFGA